MKQNEFENKVKIQMSELDLDPSDNVWIEVERRIRKEKKRRFIFWWPLFFLLIAGGAGVYFLKISKATKEEKAIEKIAVDKQFELAQNKKKELAVWPNVATNDKIDTITAKPLHINNDDGSNNLVPYDKHLVRKATITTSGIGVAKTIVMKKPLPISNKKESLLELLVINEKSLAVVDNRVEVIVINNKVYGSEKMVQLYGGSKDTIEVKKISNTNSPSETKLIDTLSKKEADVIIDATPIRDSIIKAVVTAENINVKKKGSWKWGITISLGSSALADGFGSLEKSQTFDAATSSNTPNPTLGANNYTVIKRGVSFNGAVFTQKKISAKLTMRLAASYNYLSWGFNVGSRVDSTFSPGSSSVGYGISTNGYYRTTNSFGGELYVNKYHLLGVATELSLQIVKAKKMNLYWDNRLSYKRIISSNMLHYSGTLPGYYKNNALLQKNQLFFSTALLVHMNTRFSSGPYLQYGITPVVKNQETPQRRFSSFGIRVNFLFGK